MLSVSQSLRKVLVLIFHFLFFLSILSAQNDTMYIMKSGAILSKYAVNTEVDSVLFYKPIIDESTLCGSPFVDPRDNNEYQTVQIANQCWMVENLRYLPSVVGSSTGSPIHSHYYVYGYNGSDVNVAKSSENYSIYGVLYNWPAAMNYAISSNSNPSGVQGVCPEGWHLPSDVEWTQLTNNYGSLNAAGGKLKEAGTEHWNEPNVGANNESGFTALPGGYRNNAGEFDFIGQQAYWWTTTEAFSENSWNRYIFYNYANAYRNNVSKEFGFSVRCVRN